MIDISSSEDSEDRKAPWVDEEGPHVFTKFTTAIKPAELFDLIKEYIDFESSDIKTSD
eukprot:CAMPEP_0116878874 /NCGR_PEP_ID=MMETSP0463-20121206/10624_1 /TAXON_ID=181622 /ORGANISM="Strombidinopsis sp, Strain SopsisLIS2011" /LENGTH=57 /DNA_ID=CAMNT_0004527531 /DNA_START=1066 /DNA_END=1242 /DNA_ORIENTATION=+